MQVMQDIEASLRNLPLTMTASPFRTAVASESRIPKRRQKPENLDYLSFACPVATID